MSNLNNTLMDLSQEEWAEKLANDENAFILDVRTPEEVEEGYIPGATNIDIYLGQGFLDGLEELDKSKNYYVYCRSGNRSGQACAIMNSVGFETAYNLEGGFSNWEGEVVE
ncbi:rhodanese-like domain-containing protein [Flavobacteriaceae bacterium GF1]